MFRTGLRVWPELYVMVFYMTVATGMMTHAVYTQIKNKDYVTRYKRVYHGELMLVLITDLTIHHSGQTQ